MMRKVISTARASATEKSHRGSRPMKGQTKKEGESKKIACHSDHLKSIRQSAKFSENQQQNLQINSLSKLSVNRAEQSFDKVPKISISATNKKWTISIQSVSSMPKKQKKTPSKTTKPVSPTPITSASNIQAPSNASIVSTNNVASEHLLPIPTNNREKWKKENNLKTTNKNERKMMSSKHIDTTSSDSNQKLLPAPTNVKRLTQKSQKKQQWW